MYSYSCILYKTTLLFRILSSLAFYFSDSNILYHWMNTVKCKCFTMTFDLRWTKVILHVQSDGHKVYIAMQKCRHWFLDISTMLNGINDENLISFSIRIDCMQSTG